MNRVRALSIWWGVEKPNLSLLHNRNRLSDRFKIHEYRISKWQKGLYHRLFVH
ncbi:hypothetical protein HMPREF1554_02340 [Porphyromonas gingivalis F0569]|nr:hypothetical protein HMPREF1554_02340 [Porphyromonas gingivalis F0569]